MQRGYLRGADEAMVKGTIGDSNLVLCDAHGLAYWFGAQEVTRTISPNAYVSTVENMVAPSKLPVDVLERLGVRSTPIHVLVDEHKRQRFSTQVLAHLWRPPYPEKTFVRIAPNVYVLSPIACLMKASLSMSDVSILKCLYQLTGTYRYSKDGLRERPPLMTVEEAKEYLDAAQGIRGARKVRTLLNFVVDGAASPEEANVVIVLVLPGHMGGYGLPLPTMNEPVVACKAGEQEERRPDILWKEFMLIVEYLGDEFHNRSDRFGLDAARKAHLLEAGYTVLDLTRYQTLRKNELESVVATIRKHMGLKPMRQTKDFQSKNVELRQELFGTKTV
ncbi:hypothetical protein H6A29_07885 [Collinsella tanakaei]|nr:hypothetical protein [Collinsella tanakaei]